MKKYIAITALSLSVALLSFIAGCSNINIPSDADSSDQSSSSSISSESSDHISNNSENNSESIITEPEIPKGEPTIFVGLDGNVIYTSDVTEMYDIYGDDTVTTPDKITADTENAKIICEGFGYFKEPSGVAFNNYQNSELFNGIDFIGETPKNNNECRRVNVGERFCGLTLTKARVGFEVFNGEPLYQKSIAIKEEPLAEFDGTVTLEGLLLISPRNSYEPDGGQLRFYPTENKLPIMNSKTNAETFFVSGVYFSDDFYCFNEIGEMTLKSSKITYRDIDGMNIGDIAFVRVTADRFKYYYAGVEAMLEDIEVLSDVIAHINDGF